MSYIVEMNSISKLYDGICAVNSVNLCIKKGEIYALVGQNGAGKTTIIKMLTGLTLPDQGSIKLFQSDNLNAMRRRIGALVETPAFYDHLTGEENLMFMNLLCSDQAPRFDLDTVLKLVGLDHARSKKVKKYSLGMRQRLGIALSLIGSPDFLILDEPINGLDPIGIREMQSLFLRLNREFGITILISSHILGELYKVATRYGVVANGKLVSEICFEDLKKQKSDCDQAAFEAYLIGFMEQTVHPGS